MAVVRVEAFGEMLRRQSRILCARGATTAHPEQIFIEPGGGEKIVEAAGQLLKELAAP